VKKIAIIFLLALLIISASLAEYRLIPSGFSSPPGKLLFLIFLNFNLTALLVLIFYVGKSLKGIYLERKKKIPGHRFKSRLVLLFTGLISIPTGLLFLTAFVVGTNYIDRLFKPIFSEPLEGSIEIARSFYEAEKEKTLNIALSISRGGSVPEGYKAYRVYSPTKEMPEAIRAALRGENSVEIISGKEGSEDIVLAAVGNSPQPLVVEHPIPNRLTKAVKTITEAHGDYLKLRQWAVPIKLNFLLILGFCTLVVVFLSLWTALRIANNISEPVKRLAEATEAVARGDLSVRVSAKTEDEMGLLIESFNKMVREIQDSKESLSAAYSESDRRRLCMENIVENIQSGVISIDRDGNVIMINSSALRMLGLGLEESIGKHYSYILSKIESEELQRFVKKIDLRTVKTMERQIKAVLGGRALTLRVSINGLRGSGGEYLGLLIVFDDLTDFIKAQRAIAWQEMARRVAHEIKNPLTPIKLSTERLIRKWKEKDKDFNSVFERATNTIVKEVDGLKRLVDDFTRFGKLPEAIKRPTPIRKLIEEVSALYKESYKDVEIEIRGEDIILDIDPEQFKRVFINLFDNSIEAMGGKGKISANIVLGQDMAVIEVSDSGPGIEESLRDRVFQPYFSTKKSGTGLGLAIADRIIVEHEGHIRVGDAQKGALFIIEIPLKEEGAVPPP